MNQTSFIRGYKQIWPYLKPVWFMGLLGIVLTIPVGALDAVIAYFLKPFIDNVMVARQKSFADYVPHIIICFTGIQGIFIYFSALVNNFVAGKISLFIKIALYKKLLFLDSNFYDRTTTGKIIFRFYSDADTATKGLVSNIKLFLTRFFSSLSLFLVLLYTSWHLSIVALFAILLIFIPLFIVKRLIKNVIDQTVSGSSLLFTHYNETVNGIKIVKSFGLINYMFSSFLIKANNLFNLNMSLIKSSYWLTPILNLISAIGIAGVLFFGINLILSGTISSGDFVSFIAALMMLYAPLKSIGDNYIGVQQSLLALDRIYNILNKKSFEEESEESKLKLFSIKNNIKFKNVHFAYDKKREILKGISLTIPVGKKIALVGNSGGGKTTVCSLIPRLYNVTKGSILIDGKNIKDYSLSSLRSQIAVVFQDNFLFEGTIRENIVCARENATEEDIQTAVKSACLDEFLKTLPQGIDTKIGERGVTLSGGQKQRVAIARAIIKNASLVILDEATSALDNKSEKIVQQALDNLMKGKTTIVIAHRLSTIRDADQIVVLNDGQIAEQGTHEELLEKKGVYANLYLSQFK